MYRSQEWSNCPRDGSALTKLDVDPWIGRVLEKRYELLNLIGEGAMGRVYAAVHTRIGRRFAVKVLFGDLAVQDNMRARFAREAETASRLEHANLVSVVDFGETSGQLFIVMELLDGLTLEQIIARNGALPQDRVVRLGRDIARGLRHAHERGLVHRDLKPENVVVVVDGEREIPKIVDFGVAIIAAEPDARMTRTGAVVGTPAFMSPEQAVGGDVDHRSDLYGLGMVLYYLAAGRGPFTGTAGEILRKVVVDAVPPIHSLAPNSKVSPLLESVIARLLSKHAIDRYQDASEVIAALDDLLLESGPTQRLSLNAAERPTLIPAPATETVQRHEVEAPEPRGWSPVWAAAAVAMLMLVVTLAGLLAGGSNGAPTTEPEPYVGAEAIVEPAEPVEAQRPKIVAEIKPAAQKVAPPANKIAVESPPKAKPAAATAVAPTSAPAPAKPVLSKPKPAAPRAAASMSPTELTRRYTELGGLIEGLGKKRGDSFAKPFLERYLALPFSAALRNDALRNRMAGTVARLSKEVQTELR